MDLKNILIPIGMFWVGFNSLVTGVRYVNELRDLIVVGIKDGQNLSREHLSVLRSDWIVTMLVMEGVMVFLAAFCFCSWFLEFELYAKITLSAIGLFFLSVLFGFLICGKADLALIDRKISKTPEEKDVN